MITREFNLYLHAGHSIPLVINANQYDHGEQWLFKLFNSDGTQYVPSSGAIVGIKSDNLGIINSGSVDTQGRVVINETQQMTAAVGKAVFELVIDDGTHGTANFVVLVEPKPGDNADLSETDISMIEQAVEAASTIKPYGSPLVASTVAGMTDHDKVYVYVGSETGYTSGHWYYYDGDSWEDGGVYNSVAVQTDTTLTLSGVAADAKKTGDEISDLKSQIAQGSGLTEDVKVALLACFENIGGLYLNGNARTYIENLRSALYPPANLSSISAVYTQSGDVYASTPLDDLKADLVVTAHYSDETSEPVTNYLLSGTLAEGTRTITVTYGGKTTTFNVTVIAVQLPYNLNFKFNDIVLSDGYIDDNGAVVSAELNNYYDEFIPAVGFWLVSSSGSTYKNNTGLYYRLAEYDSNKDFISRKAQTNTTPVVKAGNNTEYIKMGFNNSNRVFENSDRFVACNILDTSICTIPNSTIDANGDVQTAEATSVSDFLPVNEGFIMLMFTGVGDSALVVLYDENKQLINRGACTARNTNYAFEVTSQAKYVRFRCTTEPLGNVYVSYTK